MNPTYRPALRLALPALALAFPFTAAAHVGGPGFLGIDDNNNRMSDVFEAVYPGLTDPHADNDKDGVANEDEAAAGTNPLNNTDSLTFQSVTNTGAVVQAQFRSVNGKVYQLQASPTLTGAWTDEGSPVQGTGANLTASCPSATTRTFLRVEVSDQDSDADGVTDWEEIQAGTDRYLWDTDGDGRSDGENVRARLASGSFVNVLATRPHGSELGSMPVEFQITRHGGFLPLTVAFNLTGTALPGTDYAGSAARTVSFAAGQRTAVITLVPFSDGTTEPQETVLLTLGAGAGYTIGTAGSASGTIDDSRFGLLGRYYNTQETTYPTPPATNLNFDPTQLKTTRTDSVIDFNFGAGAPAGTAITVADNYGARWTGSLIPPSTGSYLFHVQLDRGAVLYINGVAVISQWSPTQDILLPSPEFTSAAITLVAGTRVPIQLDFRESATTPTRAEVHLSWTPPGGSKAIVPSSALSPDSTPPVITSPATVFAIIGAPFTHIVTAVGATTFSASNLPSGLSISPTTGVISGTPGGTAGLKFATVIATNTAGSSAQELTVVTIATGGTILREVWAGLTGTGVLSVPVHTPATTETNLTSLEAPANNGDNYGDRIRGYITAPTSGLYTFFISSDENAEVRVSASAEPARMLQRSFVTNASLSPGVWNGLASQQSLPVRMSGGSRYFIEIIRREQTGTDHLQVGWLRPGQTGTPEIIPGWALSPYTPPVATSPDGFLYAATLTPQNGVASLGTGSALLRVNAAKTGADLTVSWSNLTGPVTNSHIHDSRDEPGPTGAIIFDVDDADPDRLLPGGDGLDPTEVYHWNITGSGQHTYTDVIAALEGGFAYLNLHTAAHMNGEIRGYFQPVIGSQFFTPPANPPPAELTLPADPTARKADIVRFLQQATFGARNDTDGAAPFDSDSIEAVEALGYAGWLDAQLALSPGANPETLVTQVLPPPTVYFYTAPTPAARAIRMYNPVTAYNGAGPMASFVKGFYDKWPMINYSNVGTNLENSEEIWRAWWRTTCTAPDQLRHRMAFALSQILVVSEDGAFDQQARAIVHYNDLLYYHGLGNFRTLLEKVTLNPTMGRYLDMLNNKKPNLATGYIPNENFAREILQLFSIGLHRLHPDGTLVLDAGGLPVATYDQPNVVGFAHTFTGWIQPGNGNDYVTPMTTRASDHDIGEKLLLEAAVIPASGTATNASCNAELAGALDLIFHHPNIGPFICRQLIQRMVTANPSPGYLYRVARVFADNGSGTRGDLTAVVKAILLDSEARNQAPRLQPGFGHVKEPVLRATQMLRAFKALSYGEANYVTSNVATTVTVSPNANVDLSQPLAGDNIAASNSGTNAIFAGDIIRLTGQTIAAENGYYIFNGIGQPLTSTASTTPLATTYSANVSITTGPATVHVIVVEGIAVGPGNLLLLRMQTNPAENGIYIIPAGNGPITRWTGADTAAELSNAVVVVGGYHDPATLAYSNKTFKVNGVIANLGTDPVNIIDGSATQAGRHIWEMGSTGGGSFAQTPLRSPTVFNFYEPGYIFLGATGNSGLYGPEFQITSETSVVNTGNWFYELTRQGQTTPASLSNGQGYSYGGSIGRDIKLDVTAAQTAAADGYALVDYVQSMLMPNQVPPRLRTLLASYINNIPATWIAPGSSWRWYTDAPGLGASDIVQGHAAYAITNWKHPNFVDTAWTLSAGQFGYGEGDETTIIPYGADVNNKWRTCYFRTEFTVTNAAQATSLTLNLKRDDGAIIYFNGREAARSNMTTGVVYSGTTFAPASAPDDGQNFNAITIPASFLAEGRNVIAIEIHQATANTSDLSFDLELKASSTGAAASITTAERLNRISEALYLISLAPEFATQQ